MPYRVMSKRFIQKTVLTIGVLTLGTGTIAVTAAPVAMAATTSQQAISNLASKLQQFHDSLTASQLASIRAVLDVARGFNESQWESILYNGNGTAPSDASQLVQVITDMQQLTYADTQLNPADTNTLTTDESKLVTDLQNAINYPSGTTTVTGTDVYNFYENFKQAAITGLLDAFRQPDPISFTTITQNALASAAQGSVFQGLLSKYGLSVSDLPQIRANFEAAVGASAVSAASEAAVSGMSSEYLDVNGPTSVTVGATPSYSLSTNNSAPTGFQDTPIPSSLVKWSAAPSSAATFSDSNVMTTNGTGTVTVTATVHGYVVKTFTVQVNPVSVPPVTGGSGNSGGNTGGSTGGGTGSGTGTPTGGAGFSKVVLTQSVDSSAKTVSTTVSNSKVTLDVPAGAFTTPETITLSTGNATTLDTTAPAGYNAALTFGVSFSGAAPSLPITLTIQNASIPSGAKVFKVTDTGSWVPVQATVTNGKAVITFSTDPNFVIVKPYDMTKKNIFLNGKETENGVPGFIHNGTTYMPIWYVMQALKQAGYPNTWSGSTWNFTAPAGTKVNLAGISAGTGGMSIELNGKLVQKVDGVMAVDPNSKKNTTYMPVWYVMQSMKRAGVTTTWDGTNWKLTFKGITSQPTLTVGSQGSAVKQLQQLLGITADGVFGPQTAQAVRNFQNKNHLAVDGVVGPTTWAALLK